MSDNAMRLALRAMAIPAEQHSIHGWRATAYTLLEERLGYEQNIIDHQLAHTVKNTLGTAYNRTTHLDKRREMMQKYADYLDELRTAPPD